MKVWVDQDLCTGDGLCEEIAPDVFALVGGLSYVREQGRTLTQPGGAASIALIEASRVDAVFEAAEECPGECIFLEE